MRSLLSLRENPSETPLAFPFPLFKSRALFQVSVVLVSRHHLGKGSLTFPERKDLLGREIGEAFLGRGVRQDHGS